MRRIKMLLQKLGDTFTAGLMRPGFVASVRFFSKATGRIRRLQSPSRFRLWRTLGLLGLGAFLLMTPALFALFLLAGQTSASPGDTVADRVFGQPDFTSHICNLGNGSGGP